MSARWTKASLSVVVNWEGYALSPEESLRDGTVSHVLTAWTGTLLRSWDEEGTVICRNGRPGEDIGGATCGNFDQLHHNRYIRRSS